MILANKFLAEKNYVESAKYGHPFAMGRMCFDAYASGDNEKAFDYAYRAATHTAPDVRGMYMLASCYRNG